MYIKTRANETCAGDGGSFIYQSHMRHVQDLTCGAENNYSKNRRVRTCWFKKLLAEICHFNTQKNKNVFSQAISSLYMWVTIKL